MRLLFDIALWGQDPDTAQGTREDWETHLVDYRANHSEAETFGEVLRSTASHILWRTGTDGTHTTVPLVFSLLAFAAAMLIMSVVDPYESTLLADVHSTVGAAIFVLALVRRPWEVAHSKMLAISMIVVGTAALHSAFVFTAGPVAHELLISGLVAMGIGWTSGGISALRTYTPLGRRPVHLNMLLLGLGLVICSNLLELANVERVAIGIALIFLLTTQISVLRQLPRLRAVSEATAFREGHEAMVRSA